MLNQSALQTVARSWDALGLSSSAQALNGMSARVAPLYDSYCFSRIPATIEGLLTGGEHEMLPASTLAGGLGTGVKRVVLMFVDGFGWRSFERFGERHPFLRRLMRDGVVSKLTSLFPSTTASHVTCIHTGRTASQTGLYEWFQFHPDLDAVIAPLLYSFAGDRERDQLVAAGVDPSTLMNGDTLHQRLGAAGASSRYVTPAAFTPSPYNDRVCIGAEGFAYQDLASGLQTLAELCAVPPACPEYLLYYFGDYDASCHFKGVASNDTDRIANQLLDALEQWLEQVARTSAGDTLVLLTADHGMMDTTPASTVYLNREIPALERMLSRTRSGHPIVPAGSPRDFFLHVEPEHVGEAVGLLQDHLEGQAEVRATSELIDAGLFGPGNPSPLFLSRVGNVVILPHVGRTVWWYEKGRFVHRHHADHGGLSPEEMEIPLAAIRL